MHDISTIRDDPKAFDKAMKARGVDKKVADDIILLDRNRRKTISAAEKTRTERNKTSKQIGEAKTQGDDAEAESLMHTVTDLKSKLQELEKQEFSLDAQFKESITELPNIPMPDVPVGSDEEDNKQVRVWGEPKASTDKQHFEIGEALGQMDFETAAKMSGARFVILKGDLARLERALGQFMLDLHTQEFGYTEITPPLLVRDEAVFGVGQLPKFEEDLFKTTNGYWLTSTAEVTLSNLVREQIIEAEKLPMRYTALTPCFRSEAGSAGRDTRGMIRLHQFNKVELVSIVDEDEGEKELERLTNCAEEVLKQLDLPYRVMLLCTGDMGFSARKTYDLEVWLPGQGAYREISSCSYCGDFQARRMNARYRHQGEKKTRFVHTLNGSGLAVGRTLVAVLENYYNEDGSVTIPEVLQKYMNGATKIEVANNV
ncbi:MAG: serine--tRNA ligase [Alphaproteobacteria bacterium]|nr:serine--tRNA ligase [Alphaproteobacteria bacterium]